LTAPSKGAIAFGRRGAIASALCFSVKVLAVREAELVVSAAHSSSTLYLTYVIFIDSLRITIWKP
jgi:hypothetical protein